MSRVCHIMSGDLWAGAEVMAYNLMKGLTLYPGLTLRAIVLNEGRLTEELRSLGIPVEVFDESRLSFRELITRIRDSVARTPPDIIHSHRHKENILAFVASIGSGTRLVSTYHGMPEHTGAGLKQRFLTGLNHFLLSRCFETTVVVSHDIQEALINAHGFSGEKVAVIHNGIDVSPLMAEREQDVPVIGSVGRLFPVKDYPLMVTVATKVCEKRANVRFELVGDGVEYDRISALVDAGGLTGRFALRGFIADTAAVYRDIDIYMNTSIHEGIPMSVLEAMASGSPVVAPKVGGLKEIITDGVDGFLVGSRSPDDFCDCCLRLLDDPPLLERMGKAARGKVEKQFSLRNMTEGYYRLYTRQSE